MRFRALSFLAFVSACASPTALRAPALDPTNPSAPEAPTTFHTSLAVAPAAPTPHVEAYVCPMHPEVVSSQPGRCPKCGMDLVPKTGASP